MASQRTIFRTAARASLGISARNAQSAHLTSGASRLRTASRIAPQTSVLHCQRRWISEPTRGDDKSEIWDFEKVQSLSKSSSKPRPLLIDVREPHEYAAGHIPGALNIPIQSSPDAYLMGDEEFEDKFGMAMPRFEEKLVFYCKAGVRSKAAAVFAKQAGYKSVAEYPGSWLDWEGRGGESEK